MGFPRSKMYICMSRLSLEIPAKVAESLPWAKHGPRWPRRMSWTIQYQGTKGSWNLNLDSGISFLSSNLSTKIMKRVEVKENTYTQLDVTSILDLNAYFKHETLKLLLANHALHAIEKLWPCRCLGQNGLEKQTVEKHSWNLVRFPSRVITITVCAIEMIKKLNSSSIVLRLSCDCPVTVKQKWAEASKCEITTNHEQMTLLKLEL